MSVQISSLGGPNIFLIDVVNTSQGDYHRAASKLEARGEGAKATWLGYACGCLKVVSVKSCEWPYYVKPAAGTRLFSQGAWLSTDPLDFSWGGFGNSARKRINLTMLRCQVERSCSIAH